MWFVALLLFGSLCLMVVGLVLLVEDGDDALRELSPAELSTSAPVVRDCWTRLHERAQRCWPARAPRRPRPSSTPRGVVLEMADRSAGHRMLAGRISGLWSGSGG